MLIPLLALVFQSGIGPENKPLPPPPPVIESKLGWANGHAKRYTARWSGDRWVPATQVQTVTIPLVTGGIPGTVATVNIDKFDDHEGQWHLSEAAFSGTAHYSQLIFSEITTTQEGGYALPGNHNPFGKGMHIELPSGKVVVDDIALTAAFRVDRGPYDGTLDYGGESGFTWTREVDQAVTVKRLVNMIYLDELTGQGEIALQITRPHIWAWWAYPVHIVGFAFMSGMDLAVTYTFTTE